MTSILSYSPPPPQLITFQITQFHLVDQDGSVGIATRYAMDGPGIESRWGGGEILRNNPDRPWGPPSLLYSGYRVFLWGKAAGTWR